MNRVEPRMLPTQEKAALAAVARAVSPHVPAPRAAPPMAAPPMQAAAPVQPAPAPAEQPKMIQLRLKRSQRTAGVLSSKVVFALDARTDLSSHAQSLVQKYKLGPLVVYDSAARTKHTEMAGAHFLDSNNAPGVGRQLSGLARGLASAAIAAMSLRITVDSLASGHHIECKDLNELVGAEQAIVEACENIKGYLDVAETFDGREQVIGF